MAPWYLMHLHQFAFERLFNGPRNVLSPKTEVLKVTTAEDLDSEDDFQMQGIPAQREFPKIDEEKLKLRDIYESSGRLHSAVSQDGSVLPLTYLYDFGVGT